MLACATVAGFVWLMVFIVRLPRPTAGHPDFMVSITVVDGLNLEATTSGGVPTTTLSPVFNLTVRIVNPGNVNPGWDSACVWGLSTAVVSYVRGRVPGQGLRAAVLRRGERGAGAHGHGVGRGRGAAAVPAGTPERRAGAPRGVAGRAGDHAGGGGLFPVHRQGACMALLRPCLVPIESLDTCMKY